MSARPYRLGRREAAVEDARARVIAAAREVIAEAGFYRASLDDIARRSGVARATVYYQFKSKYGLLDAAIADTLRGASGEPGRRRASERPDAAEAMLAYVQAACRFWASDGGFYRSVIGLAAVDPEASEVVDAYDLRRREEIVWLVKRLHDQGRLREGMTQRRAVDTIWLLTSFRSFDHMFTRSGLSARATTALLRDLAATILAPRPSTA